MQQQFTERFEIKNYYKKIQSNIPGLKATLKYKTRRLSISFYLFIILDSKI